MLLMNYVFAVIYGKSTFSLFNVESCMDLFLRKPTEKTKIAQFKEVIKTVPNQYLSLQRPWWGFSTFPSPPYCPCLALRPLAPLIDSCSAPSNKPDTAASCSCSGLKMTCDLNHQMTLKFKLVHTICNMLNRGKQRSVVSLFTKATSIYLVVGKNKIVKS